MTWWRTSCRCEHKGRVLRMTRVSAFHVIHYHHHCHCFILSFGVQSSAEIVHPPWPPYIKWQKCSTVWEPNIVWIMQLLEYTCACGTRLGASFWILWNFPTYLLTVSVTAVELVLRLVLIAGSYVYCCVACTSVIPVSLTCLFVSADSPNSCDHSSVWLNQCTCKRGCLI